MYMLGISFFYLPLRKGSFFRLRTKLMIKLRPAVTVSAVIEMFSVTGLLTALTESISFSQTLNWIASVAPESATSLSKTLISI